MSTSIVAVPARRGGQLLLKDQRDSDIMVAVVAVYVLCLISLLSSNSATSVSAR